MATATATPPSGTTSERTTLRSVNPYDGRVLKTFTEMSSEEVSDAIAKAYDGFKSWRRVSFAERGAMLRRAAVLCRQRREDLARLMALEMGKRIIEGRAEVDLCARIYDYYAENGERFLKPQLIPSPRGTGRC